MPLGVLIGARQHEGGPARLKGRGTSFVTMTVTRHVCVNNFVTFVFKIQGHSRDPHEICVHKKRMPCVKSNDSGEL